MYHLIKKTRRFVTLIEMMIVIALIGMIVAVLGYNYQGSLEKGKKFRSTTGIAKLDTILTMYLIENPGADIGQWESWVDNSDLAKNKTELKKDGWGVPYTVNMDNNGKIVISDSKHNNNNG
jgi:general secretion pathway protein G